MEKSSDILKYYIYSSMKPKASANEGHNSFIDK